MSFKHGFTNLSTEQNHTPAHSSSEHDSRTLQKLIVSDHNSDTPPKKGKSPLAPTSAVALFAIATLLFFFVFSLDIPFEIIAALSLTFFVLTPIGYNLLSAATAIYISGILVLLLFGFFYLGAVAFF